MPIMRYPTENITTNAEEAPVFSRWMNRSKLAYIVKKENLRYVQISPFGMLKSYIINTSRLRLK